MCVQFQGVNEVTFKSWANVILAFFFKCLIIKMGFLVSLSLSNKSNVNPRDFISFA